MAVRQLREAFEGFETSLSSLVAASRPLATDVDESNQEAVKMAVEELLSKQTELTQAARHVDAITAMRTRIEKRKTRLAELKQRSSRLVAELQASALQIETLMDQADKKLEDANHAMSAALPPEQVVDYAYRLAMARSINAPFGWNYAGRHERPFPTELQLKAGKLVEFAGVPPVKATKPKDQDTGKTTAKDEEPSVSKAAARTAEQAAGDDEGALPLTVRQVAFLTHECTHPHADAHAHAPGGPPSKRVKPEPALSDSDALSDASSAVTQLPNEDLLRRLAEEVEQEEETPMPNPTASGPAKAPEPTAAPLEAMQNTHDTGVKQEEEPNAEEPTEHVELVMTVVPPMIRHLGTRLGAAAAERTAATGWRLAGAMYPSPVLLASLLAMSSFTAAAGAASSSSTIVPQAHVAVIGGGLAGLAATIEAQRNGARVTLVEKEARIGGNSAKATSGMNGVHSRAQRLAESQDSVQTFVNDTLRAGRGLCNEALVDVLAQHSGEAVDFVESFGVQLDVLSQLGGHSFARTHREANTPEGRPKPVGFDIVAALRGHVETLAQLGLVHIATSSRVAGLSRAHAMPTESNGAAMGRGQFQVNIETAVGESTARMAQATPLLADAVVLATGGYSSSASKLHEHAPWLEDLATTNGPWAQGEGLDLGLSLGGMTEHLDKVQVHPTGFVDPTNPAARTLFLAPEALRGAGALLLNNMGHRFVDELAPRDTVTGSIWRYASYDTDSENLDDPATPVHEQRPTDAEAFLVMNKAAIKKFGPSAFSFYSKVKKFFTEVSGTTGLAEYINGVNQERQYPIHVEERIVRDTIEAYNRAAEHDFADAFEKQTFPVNYNMAVSFGDHPLFVARIKPVVHYTMGGLRVSPEGQLLDTHNQTIDGVFAAGEVSSGVHGANRLAGNSLLECVVFGRLAGQGAAAAATKATADLRHAHDEL
ncbi:uncharacterized protein MONBRDRAFT_37712 [Monosiga brevicollis MX1]|uniref:FAD-dependent oxidoreductase 2 FAD-binding domain-containing protein n=1 Tax=Monosiga brevicollis TaxID=81824 RepID=A9V3F5_MONBE|nr:uncharacterized protein MONBRDRAFT_37712 [Monosiga brevicollis MX1]EDQ88178.1 predicted protein [Monosiga brevicollis MX1]|eukprot:XP_001747254.1 hypothetical protein [Monosiga brevicollis MX1]